MFSDIPRIPIDEQGNFQREASPIRNFIGSDQFPAEAGRYHLYASYAGCWPHRTLIMHKLKKLENIVSLSFVAPEWSEEHGWMFTDEFPDPINGKRYLKELYPRNIDRRTTVPVLWDKESKQIVSVDSGDIMRMFNSAFEYIAPYTMNMYPMLLRKSIDRWNERIYDEFNNGVYRVRFAGNQAVYDKAVKDVFICLDILEDEMSDRFTGHSYLCGSTPMECDWRLFPTLFRFDLVYYSHFKCNLKMLREYPCLHNYMIQLWNWPGVKDTINIDHIKRFFYRKSPRNPLGILPAGPNMDFLKKMKKEKQ